MSGKRSFGGPKPSQRPATGLLAKSGPNRYVSVTDKIKQKKESATINKYKELKQQEEAKERRKQKKRERRKRKRESSASSVESDGEEPENEASDAHEAEEAAPVYRGKESIGSNDLYDQMLTQVKRNKREKGRNGGGKRQKLDNNADQNDEDADMERIRRRAMMTSGGDDDYDMNSDDEVEKSIPDGSNVIGATSDGVSGRRQRANRPQRDEDGGKPTKADPFFKEKKEFEVKLTEKERKDKEIKERLAHKKAQKEKRDQSRKNLLYKRTKSGQPLMKGVMQQLLGKIEASVGHNK